ncbi:hemerythrin domain-containing protein [Roseivirga sp. E12]|uniref:hemerythrin domain-containing protein n=1 Tax=Roseivirga sp. E12 TaxID=2819237 RepID=UPI001ABD257D|nr:hemerythrin domain-containing protein [Roseivirga sp. E12]MBO3697430.1 hemerythrin domain-containing protein [Roseivirga sp. E12]
MKRHDSLVLLSRFHRSCLFLALIAKENSPEVKGYPTDILGKIDYAISFYDGPLKKHFELEERLWNYISNRSNELKTIIDELTAERIQLHELFIALSMNNSESTLNQIGNLLETHVRKEERVLFQQIQNDLTEKELSHIATILS